MAGGQAAWVYSLVMPPSTGRRETVKDPAQRRRGPERADGAGGWVLVQSTMRPVLVVVADVLANSHSEHGGMPAIADKEIAALRKTTGPDFDRRFLNVMIAYQDDAIQLARVETVTGSDPNAKALAGHIDRSRSAEIRQMLGFLGQS